LFNYITGENIDQANIAMTAPVQISQKGVEIAMTAPVQSVNTEQGWTISFIVPKKYTRDTVPQPTNPLVYLREIPGSLQAVQRFSGRWTEENFLRAKNELYSKLEEIKVTPLSEPISAAYNSPFSIPWFRRNEVIVNVDSVPTDFLN